MTPVERLAWLTPAPLWTDPTTGIDGPTFEQPWLAEFSSDTFVADFLTLLGSTVAPGPAGLATRHPSTGSGTVAEPYVLYQPLHGRFYLVVGSLVCRRIGLPDREVAPSGQRVSFVVRRLRPDGGEEAWIPGGAGGQWTAAADPSQFQPGEEQQPLHAAAVGAPVAGGTLAHLLGLDEPGARSVHFGYVPVGSRAASPAPLADPVAALAQDVQDPKDTKGRQAADDARLMEFRLRIAGPWSELLTMKATTATASLDLSEPSLYLLLDLRDWLQKWLPDVLHTLDSNVHLDPKVPALTNYLSAINITKTSNKIKNSSYPLGLALQEVAGYAPLVGGAEMSGPTDTYDVSDAYTNDVDPHGKPITPLVDVDKLSGSGAGGGGYVLTALQAPGATPEQVPPELAHSVVARLDPSIGTATPDLHVLRLAYEHEPCEPVLSKPSPVVRLAATYDPDAPARSIRIELPDPAHQRRFTRGVAMDMPPKLRQILDGVTPDMLKGNPPGDPGGWELGMICSFSIQIVMLVAFIIMFIFLILLNIVFWWLPFLKICFPVPRKR